MGPAGRAPEARRAPVRITLLGPESTGKTTLAAELVERLAGSGGAVWAREAARTYAAARRRALPANTPPNLLLTAADVAPIAHAQIGAEVRAEQDAVRAGAAFLVRDTDLVSTVVYARHYYGFVPSWIAAAARERRADLYLLCDIDLSWVADDQRDRPHAREELRDAFVDALMEFDCRWAWVRGVGPARADAAMNALRRLTASADRPPVRSPGAA